MKTQTSKHTPGPWYVEYDSPTAVIPGHLIKESADPQCPTAIIWEGGGAHGKQTSKANARLIAAAPDTYAVCKMLIEGKVSYQELLTSAIHAIARAEGNGEE